jgi:hypothetical protein
MSPVEDLLDRLRVAPTEAIREVVQAWADEHGISV